MTATLQSGKKKKSASPTQRSLQYFRKTGWHAGIVERWNSHVGIRQDLFGFVDLILIKPAVFGTTFVQVSSFGGLPARIRKVLDDEKMRAVLVSLLIARNQMWFVGWRKVGRFWQPTIRQAALVNQPDPPYAGRPEKIAIRDVMRDGAMINPLDEK